VALPDWTEGSLVANWLSENQFEPVHRSTMEAAANEIRTRPFNLIIADASWAVSKTFQTPDRGCNTTAPNILIGDASDRRATAMVGQAMYLTRPIELAVLSCFVSMALMEDKPVRRSPRKTVQRFDALVNGEAAAIVDVSAEGFRLELPRTRRPPPPYFAVRIPLVGVADHREPAVGDVSVEGRLEDMVRRSVVLQSIRSRGSLALLRGYSPCHRKFRRPRESLASFECFLELRLRERRRFDLPIRTPKRMSECRTW
jgi:hypothetical protein